MQKEALAKLCWNPQTYEVKKTLMTTRGKSHVSSVAKCYNEGEALEFARHYFTTYWGKGEVRVVYKKRRVCFHYELEQPLPLIGSMESRS